ncbi:GreA/GreB family elongation factor [Rubellimicrobium mesophilum DSM 19309]|uniref:GreA/GreB family elongation factor n=1 Tax=Rubellimicrobium mesophilum DSM 19309 TaxID=442562 RepID=A0A017HR91_9RHOB|nr:hypothetical protein [Rubellimicrobium mesophilum]EYD76668.1 GreA/GreB family elongation factor [Rubellimicrobium mesophilum DSM 19309]
MISGHPITLTPRTFALLEGLRQQLDPGQDILRVMLSRKLEAATIVFAPEIDPQVATLNSRVRFRIGAGSADERVLVWGADGKLRDATLPISVPRGLALLGMQAGRSAAIPTVGGEVEHVVLEAVLDQPEAARSAGATAPIVQPASRASGAVVTSLSTARMRRGAILDRTACGDDPGPSAA